MLAKPSFVCAIIPALLLLDYCLFLLLLCPVNDTFY